MRNNVPLKWYQFRLRSLLALMLTVQLACIVTVPSVEAYKRYTERSARAIEEFHRLRAAAEQERLDLRS